MWFNLSKAWSLLLQKVKINSPHLLEKEMTTHSSILAWKIPWTEKPGSLQSMGSEESDTTKRQSMHEILGSHKGLMTYWITQNM